MANRIEQFQQLPAAQRRLVQLQLCERALDVWRDFASRQRTLTYRESVTGTSQTVDPRLPADALESARAGRDMAQVEARYAEPIVAMQDLDLEFPEQVQFAYYSLYNLFQRHVLADEIDDWVIVNQALSAQANPADWTRLLDEALDAVSAD